MESIKLYTNKIRISLNTSETFLLLARKNCLALFMGHTKQLSRATPFCTQGPIWDAGDQNPDGNA